MNYLISTFDGYVFNNELTEILSNVKYRVDACVEEKFLVLPTSGAPFVFDPLKTTKNVLLVKDGGDKYYFLFSNSFNQSVGYSFKFKNKNISISLSDKLCVFVDEELKCEKNVENLKYSHYEIFNDFCLIYFFGKRDFLVVLKENVVEFSSYYDEYNFKDNEKYFMCRLKDSLNHGKVCQVGAKEISQYLVYLDDEQMNLSEEFVALVFLDCLLAGNLKYCDKLMADSIKLTNEKDIKNFFPDFDFYYPITYNRIILIKKNTLTGIYNFEIENCKIANIFTD